MAICLWHIRRSGAERQQHCDAAAPIEATAVVNQIQNPTTNPYKYHRGRGTHEEVRRAGETVSRVVRREYLQTIVP